MNNDEVQHFTRIDRDLLVRVETKVERIGTDLRDMAAGLANANSKLESLEDKKISRVEVVQMNADHEIRIRRLELWGAVVAGGLAILQFLAPFILKKYL